MQRFKPFTLASMAFLGACQGAPTRTEDGRANESVGQAQQALSWDHVTARITASDASIVPRAAPAESTWHATLQEDGRDHYIVEQAVSEVGEGNARHAPISQLISLDDPDCDGRTCLKFTGFGTNYGDHPPRGTNDRIEVEVLAGDQPGGMPLNEWRYLRFFLLVSPATQPPPPGQDIIIAQTWQVHNGPNWRAPAFKISLRAGLKLQFTYYNDEIAGYDQGIPVYAGHTFHEEPIVTGSWMSFHLAMKAVPKPVSGTGPLGAIMIWKNAGTNYVPTIDQFLINRNNKEFNWGYRPVGTNSAGTSCVVTSNCVKGLLTQRLGIYRNDSAPVGSFVSFKMDSIKITTDEAYMPGY